MTGQGVMKWVGLVTMCAGLAGCGADGEPVKPTLNTSVSVGTDGVSASTGVGLRKGPLSIGLSL